MRDDNDFDEAFLARFWARVDTSAGPGACWLWTAGTGNHGYGLIWRGGGATRLAHRSAYEIATGPIPEGLAVRHKCDNRLCVNPAHLEIGTQADNLRDMDERGRRGTTPGEKHGNVKLSAADIPIIRTRHAAGESQHALAREYGVNQGTISHVVKRTTWKHIP